jgi:hypothetical protein
MAVAMIGPMPGTLARRWLTGLLLCQAMSCFSIRRNRRLQLLNLCGQNRQTREIFAAKLHPC